MYFKTRDAGEFQSASNYRKEARAQLDGHWKESIMLAAIPTLIIVIFGLLAAYTVYKFSGMDFTSVQEGASSNSNGSRIFVNIGTNILSMSISFAMLQFVRNMKTHFDWKKDFLEIFKLPFFWKLVALEFVRSIFIGLWSLLFIVPGIIQTYGYSQAVFIFYDEYSKNPNSDMKVTEALKESQKMMKGRKMKKFLLDFSFIGWYLLSLVTLGLGMFALIPYTKMANVIFYENARMSIPHTDLSNQEIHDMYQNQSANDEPIVGEDPDDFSDF